MTADALTSPFAKSGWAISYVIVSWRRTVSPMLRKAEKTEDPELREALMIGAAEALEGKARALRAGAKLAATTGEDAPPTSGKVS